MSRIRGRDTKPEVLLRKALWETGLRYRLNYKLTGKPDLVFVGKRIAVFVDGCFWHGCPDHCQAPATNKRFWKEKLARNKTRDKDVNEALSAQGWSVLRFWEHDIKENLESCVKRVLRVCSQR